MMIRVLTTCYNAEPFIRRCLNSIRRQKGRAFHCYIADDLSTDSSMDVIGRTTEGDSRFTLIRNDRKYYQPGNYWQIVHRAEVCNEDICITVDGDDWLPDGDECVFDRVAAAYEDGRTWLTWGSYLTWRGDGRRQSGGISRPLSRAADVRALGWVTSHLRTFKAFLYKAIKEEDLKSPTGQFWEVAGDMAFMFPMIEMAGDERIKHLHEINYIYNDANPLSDHRTSKMLQMQYDAAIRQKQRYSLLDRN